MLQLSAKINARFLRWKADFLLRKAASVMEKPLTDLCRRVLETEAETIVSHLCLRDAANFHRAFPEVNFSRARFPQWLSPPQLPRQNRRVGLTNDFGTLDFPRYLKYAHQLSHSRKTDQHKFLTDQFMYFRLQPTPSFVRAGACKFFPPEAPEPFANGFVLADDAARLHFFALQEHEFKLISIYHTLVDASSLIVSPKGTTLLVIEGKRLNVLKLSHWRIEVIDQIFECESTWTDNHFLSENSFLLIKRPYCTGNVSKIIFDGKRPLSEITLTTLPPLPVDMRVTDCSMFSNVPNTDVMLHGIRWNNRHLLLGVARWGAKNRGYICTKSGVLGQWTYDPFGNRVYLVVINTLSMAAFLAGDDAPCEQNFLALEEPNVSYLKDGHILIYASEPISDDTPLKFVPRFYLGCRGNFSHQLLGNDHRLSIPDPWFHRCNYSMASSIRLWINRHTLMIRVENASLALMNLFSTPDSVPTFLNLPYSDGFSVAATSQHGSFMLFFPLFFSHWSDLKGLKECPEFANMYSDTRMFKIKLHSKLIHPNWI